MADSLVGSVVDASIGIRRNDRNAKPAATETGVSFRDSAACYGRFRVALPAPGAYKDSVRVVSGEGLMHETAIVEGLMRILEKQAAQHGVERIVRVRLKVGRLRAVEPQQLVACFEMFADGTIAEGATLFIDAVPVRARCKACGTEFEVPRFRFECSGCGGGDVEVIQGQELYIESFDAADDIPSGSGPPGIVPK
jgi:hydrogenase nickel incorporation protein HypA/HybF